MPVSTNAQNTIYTASEADCLSVAKRSIKVPRLADIYSEPRHQKIISTRDLRVEDVKALELAGRYGGVDVRLVALATGWGLRKSQERLQLFVNEGLLKRYQRPVFRMPGQDSTSTPMYFATPQCRSLLKLVKGGRAKDYVVLRSDQIPNYTRESHSLPVSRFEVLAHQNAQQMGAKLLIRGERQMLRSCVGLRNVPDAWLVLQPEASGQFHFFYECDNDTEGLLRKWAVKFHGYEEMIVTGKFTQRFSPADSSITPRILVTVPDLQRANQLAHWCIETLSPVYHSLFYIAPYGLVEASNFFTAPIWLRVGAGGTAALL